MTADPATAVAVAALAISVMAHLWARLPRRRRTAPASWYELLPRTKEIDPHAAPRAMNAVRRARRPGRIVVARLGGGAQAARCWLGIVAAADADKAAESLAAMSGCQARPDEPPEPPSGLQWWRSWPTRFATTPRRLDDLARDPDAVERAGVADFADHANRYLEAGDWLIVEARPDRRDSRALTAAAMTTCEPLATTWTDFGGAELLARRPRPHVSAVPAVAAALLGAGVALGATGRMMWLAGPAAASVGAAAAVSALAAGRRAFMASPDLLAVEGGCRVRLPSRWSGRWAALLRRLMRRRSTVEGESDAARRMTMPLPAAEAAGWMAAGSMATEIAVERYAPAEMLEPPPDDGDGNPLGVPLGHDLADRPVFIDDADRANAVVAFGDPGYGKTTFLLNVLAGDCGALAAGARFVVPMWIEAKEEAGAGRALRVMRAAGSDRGALRPLVLSAAERGGVILDLIDWQRPAESAQALTAAMRYAFGEGDIHERSRSIIEAAFAAVIACPAAGREALGYGGAKPNVAREALALIGGAPVDRPREWVLERVSGTPEADHFRQWTPRKGGFTKHQLDQMLVAPVTKLDAIAAAEGLWEHRSPHGAPRPSTTFEALLSTATPTIFALYPPEAGAGYDKTVAVRIASLLMYLLSQSVQKHCDGWQAKGRAVAVYCDELRALAGADDIGTGEDVVSELLDTGRSFGVNLVLATQRPGQVRPHLREALTSSGCKVYFRLEDRESAESASADLADAYTAGEIRSLGVGRGAARITRAGRPNAAFTLLPANIEDHDYARPRPA